MFFCILVTLWPFELIYHFHSFCNMKNNSDCAPFEESLTQPQEEEPPKSLLEVRLQILIIPEHMGKNVGA